MTINAQSTTTNRTLPVFPAATRGLNMAELTKALGAATTVTRDFAWKPKIGYVMFPRDVYDDFALTADEWLARETNAKLRTLKWEWLMRVFHFACEIVRNECVFRLALDLRGAPHVSYDAATDQPIAIIKLDDKGTTLVICEQSLGLDEKDDLYVTHTNKSDVR